MEIHASLCMIEGITSLGGRWRKNGRKQKRQGREIWLWEWMDEEEGGVGHDDDEDELPFACFICREQFVDPVVTKCKHYFCEHCALKHHAKNKKCFVCNEPTLGIFNSAQEIRKRMAEAGKR
uniref:RING-type domain-containing protein n=1 Tax=Salix viminalis TaxID=40686 RepID=A0A6N2KV06_SALVM